MITTQYKITLPSDYKMDIIKERVKQNGFKTDGFQDLKFKLYLITEKGVNGNIENSYCPLYLWKSHEGLNKFLFEGFYDNILNSFGWQQIKTSIPLMNTTTSKIKENNYLFHCAKTITPKENLNNLIDEIKKELSFVNELEYLVSYNPETWKYDVFYFSKNISLFDGMDGKVYTILHVSQ